MVIKGDSRYIKQLTSLWLNVFGDNEDYVKIFFGKQYAFCETFAYISQGNIVSAFYLLPCTLNYNGKSFVGRYLYAAATDTHFRGKGIMAQLIDEAKAYCENNGVDFISLVPANEGLYGYYGKFGFVAAMHKFRTDLFSDGMQTANDYVQADTDTVKQVRDKISFNSILFGKNELDYISASMKSYGCEFVRLQNGYCILNIEDSVVEEYVGAADEIESAISSFDGNVTVFSPYNALMNNNSEKIKFGMICPINDELSDCSDIYMNLALD